MPTSFLKSIPCLKLTPSEAAARSRHLPGMVFFDTALDTPDALSILAAEPIELFVGKTEADWDALRRAIAMRQMSEPRTKIPTGFAAGWVDYDGAYCFGIYDKLLVYRHRDDTWLSVGDAEAAWADALASEAHIGPTRPLCFSSSMSREDFIHKVEQAQEYIAAGDIYQVNLSHRFTAPWSDDDIFTFYQALRRFSPAPHAAYLSMNGRSVLSSSPELFLEIEDRRIRTRPIKGTRPRRIDPAEDSRSAEDLVASSKERAELIMITDLERNDLGQVCEFGSVIASELLKLETFEQVFHLVSTVEGQLRPDVDAVTALRACFPGGSITGAPKKRAMEIIAEQEPVPRGLYTGAIGYFGFNGVSQFNIAIRTVVIENSVAHFHVGAGIVADSKPSHEWQETLDKAAGILLAAKNVAS